MRFVLRICRNHIDTGHHKRFPEIFGWPKMIPVILHRLDKIRRGKMAGKDIGQPTLCCQDRAAHAGSQYINRHVQSLCRECPDIRAAVVQGKIPLQILQILWKIIDGLYSSPPQRGGGSLVCPRRASQSEVDSSGIEPFQCPDLFGHHERAVVGHHDSTRPDADRTGTSGDVPHQDHRRRTPHIGHVVMFGQPDPLVAPGFRMSGQIQASGIGIGSVGSFPDQGKVKD